MHPNRAHLILRRINNTLRVSLPREFILRQGLSEGDHVVWTEHEDGVKLKFVKLAELEELAETAA
jgi:hypothetical protein